jgi:hypothetical protein
MLFLFISFHKIKTYSQVWEGVFRGLFLGSKQVVGRSGREWASYA